MSLNFTLKMEAADFSETFVTDYHIARRNISEDSSLRGQFCAFRVSGNTEMTSI